MPHNLIKLIGNIPSDSNQFKKRMRLHQGWWRAFVLGELPGLHPLNSKKTICSTISNGMESKSNFLTPNALKAYEQTLGERCRESAGIVNDDRVWNNLLSSQPLCFNFFGELKLDLPFASRVIRNFLPTIEEITDVKFEYAPEENYTGDNSAFDVAFFYRTTEGKRGVWGLECKYTDDFSTKLYWKESYKTIFSHARDKFSRPYREYAASGYNQLFRNELIAESMIQHHHVDEAFTGLFYCNLDESTFNTGMEFREMLVEGGDRFKIVSQKDFITAVQKMDLSWEQREWVMMLWARYLGLDLSRSIIAKV